MKSKQTKPKNKNTVKLDTLIDKEAYLVESAWDGSSAIYVKHQYSDTKAKLLETYDTCAFIHPWPDKLSIEKCLEYGKKIDVKKMFLEAL